MADPHYGDIGTDIVLTITNADTKAIISIAGATTLEIKFQKPNGSDVTVSAGYVTDGTDGKLKYQTTSGFLDQVGTWAMQAHVQLSGGEWHSTRGSFQVLPVIGTI